MTWDEVAKSQGGAISRRQLLEAGIDRRQVGRLVASKQLVRRAQGVFVARGVPDTYAAALWASVLRTDGLIGFATAAHLWGVIDQPPQIDVVVHPRRRIAPARNERLHRVVVPDSAVTSFEGLPVTDRRWSLMDYAGSLSIASALTVVDRALQRGWLLRSDIRSRLKMQPCRTGNVVLRRVLSITEDGAAAESERRLHSILRGGGLTGWTANFQITARGVVVAIIDVAFPDRRVAIEVDGMAYHSDTERFVHDRRRQNDLIGLGWTVLRFTWWDLVERPDDVLARIRLHLG